MTPLPTKTLIFLATYNEADNVIPIYRAIRAVLPLVDLLFVDDASPDGTGRLLDDLTSRDPRCHVIHRSGKLGIGSAHKAGIRWAYDHGYETLVTMDCDLAHSPDYLPVFLNTAPQCSVVVGTRFTDRGSLAGWNLYRKLLTHAGHALTRTLLAMPYDATGAFRRYDLRRIPRHFLELVRSDGYSFFFESLHILFANRHAIQEVPIRLPPRTYGDSKMRLKDVIRGALFLISYSIRWRLRRGTILLQADGRLNTAADWDDYWAVQRKGTGLMVRLYEKIAAFYRNNIIRPTLDHHLAYVFQPGSKLLHAGCGSGAVDETASTRYKITACDFSHLALIRYGGLVGNQAERVEADLFHIPLREGSLDGLYNLGVMEHFDGNEVQRLLCEFRRLIRRDGRIVLFWPHEFALSVTVLKIVHFVLNDILGKGIHLHPAELTRIRSRHHAAGLLAQAGFQLESFSFGWRDLFTHAVIVARRSDMP